MEITMETAVMEHDKQFNGVQSGKVSDWFGGTPEMGKELTDEEAEKLSAYRGYRLPLQGYFAFLLDDASGTTVHVYLSDPLR